ncbi:MAG TPA: pyridoxamine 5'-phosphate oxidase family protein [Clostridia bacterium]|nr:pyridoxamine 5'-phosphate oxidase family protein [Clostridia bacterium]
MRRKDRKMEDSFALQVVDGCPFAVMSVVLPDGQPYGIPLSIARIDDTIYFHCALEGKKLDALLHHPRVSMACVMNVQPLKDQFTTEYESAIVSGTASRVLEDTEKIKALRAIATRYTPDNMDQFDDAISQSLKRTDVWQMEIDEITGKRKKYDAEGNELKYGRTV